MECRLECQFCGDAGVAARGGGSVERWDGGGVAACVGRLPAEAGGAVPVLPHELEAVLYRAEPEEWPPRGDRGEACRAIANHIGQVNFTFLKP